MGRGVMENSLISHVGIAVTDLDQAIKKYSLLFNENNPAIHDVQDQKVKVAIFDGGSLKGGSRIELVAATNHASPIAKFIDKNGEGLHHICIYVENIEKKLIELQEAGVQLIDKIPRIGAEGNKIAFVHPADLNGVLIELEEIPKA